MGLLVPRVCVAEHQRCWFSHKVDATSLLLDEPRGLNIVDATLRALAPFAVICRVCVEPCRFYDAFRCCRFILQQVVAASPWNLSPFGILLRCMYQQEAGVAHAVSMQVSRAVLTTQPTVLRIGSVSL